MTQRIYNQERRDKRKSRSIVSRGAGEKHLEFNGLIYIECMQAQGRKKKDK